MRIQVWQAFASNNSGSYTIAGRFEDAAIAHTVAAELGELIVAHSAWLRDHPWEDTDGSPLQAFVLARRLPVAAG